MRASLLRAGDWDELCALAEWEADLRADLRLREARRDGDDLVLALDATVVAPDGPLRFERRGERVLWRPPASVLLPDDRARDATDDLGKGDVYTVVRSTADGSDFALPVRIERRLIAAPTANDGGLRPRIDVAARLSAATGAAGRPLPAGDWEARATPSVVGFKATGRVRRHRRGPSYALTVTSGGELRERRAGLRDQLAGVAAEWADANPWFVRTPAVRMARRLLPQARRAQRRVRRAFGR